MLLGFVYRYVQAVSRVVLPVQNKMIIFFRKMKNTNTSEVCATEIHPAQKNTSCFHFRIVKTESVFLSG